MLGVHKVYVGSLPLSSTVHEMKRLFDAYGTVESALVIKGKISGRSRGFGFVEMSTSQETVIAIAELNGTELGGRALQVSEARPRILTP
ncbi:MAG: RNA-binding protein [Nitrospirota bacterium]|nr:RNA-binding protein [Nitrospirota bacterium]